MRSGYRFGRWAWVLLLVVEALGPRSAAAIPVFARIYNKPCSACHTIYPQLNPAGEYFRAKGLHGLEPAIEPIKVFPGLDVPGTLPLAIALGIGEDITRTQAPGRPSPTNTHFNLEFLALLAGGELGPHLAFLADYAPLYSIPSTGDLKENTRVGLGFLQAHAEPADWLLNFKGGVLELPLGISPRVHRLTVQPYLVYNLTAFSMLGRPPPVITGRTDTLVLASTQIALEASGLEPPTGRSFAIGVTNGSNNRKDSNSEKDVYFRLAQDFGLHRAGLFFLYSPNLIDQGPRDWAVRVGPDVTLYHRQASMRGQFLAFYDSNPTGTNKGYWYYGTFLEGEYRWTSELASLARVEYAWSPQFDDLDRGGTTDVRRQLWQITGGGQWLVLENFKLVAEASYGENHDGVSDRTSNSWLITLRAQTAFWPLTPPGLRELESWWKR